VKQINIVGVTFSQHTCWCCASCGPRISWTIKKQSMGKVPNIHLPSLIWI